MKEDRHAPYTGVLIAASPLDDPAWDAVRLAIAMQERAATLAQQWHRRGHNLGLGIGIAVGYATCGEIGFEGRPSTPPSALS